MLYLLGFIALIFIIYGLILFIKRGNKEFNPKLSLKERTELEKIVEKKINDDEIEKVEKKEIVLYVKEKIVEPSVPKIKPVYPSKEIQNEISKFLHHVDIENLNLQHSIRNGAQKFLDQDFMLALEEFSIAIESNPKDATGYYCRGLTKLKLKNYESAISDFSEAIILKAKEPNTLYYRALSYYYMHNIEDAILNFKSFISLESNSAEAYYDLGICLKEAGKTEESINNFSLAIQKRPVFEMAYFERGLLRHKQGETEGGCGDLKKALGLGYQEAAIYLDKLCK